MKTFSLLLSVIVFTVSGYYFTTSLKYSLETNYVIYMLLLLILMLICVVGMIINAPSFMKNRRRMKELIYNSYSDKRTRNENFDKTFHFLKK
ncbi:MAG TPA: hypothetical protein VF677_14215 [Flavobacterium sp.]|jgi:membrane protein DedA with SNARE-associated domain